MSTLPPIPLIAVPGGALPPGWSPAGQIAPSGILPPPPGIVEAQELAFVRKLNGASHTPQCEQFTAYLSEHGGKDMWFDFAKQYRRTHGFVRGWLGTGLMAVAMGVTALRTGQAKAHYQRLRPFQVDGTITPIGKVEQNPSYPSGHTAAAYAASTVLSYLWPERAYEFGWWAKQVGTSRVAAGMHFPSDVRVGALLGRKVGLQVASAIA
jgi:hypothetical protein